MNTSERRTYLGGARYRQRTQRRYRAAVYRVCEAGLERRLELHDNVTTGEARILPPASARVLARNGGFRAI